MKNSIAALALAGLSITAYNSNAATWILNEVSTESKAIVTVTINGSLQNENTGYSASSLNVFTGAKASKSGKLGDQNLPFSLDDITDENLAKEYDSANIVAAVKADNDPDSDVFSLTYRASLEAAANKKFGSKISAADLKLTKLEAASAAANSKREANLADITDSVAQAEDVALSQDILPAISQALGVVKEAYAALSTDDLTDGLAKDLTDARVALKDAQADLVAEKKSKDATLVSIAEKQQAVVDAEDDVKAAEKAIADAKVDLKNAIKTLNGAASTPSEKFEVASALKQLASIWASHAKAVSSRAKLQAASTAAANAVAAQEDVVANLNAQYNAALVPSSEAYLSVIGADEDSYVIATVLRPNEKKPFVYAGYGAVTGADDAESIVLRFGLTAGNYVLAINGESGLPASYLTNGVAGIDGWTNVVAPQNGSLFTNGRLSVLEEDTVADEKYNLVLKNNKLAISQRVGVNAPTLLKSKLTVLNGLIQGTVGTDRVIGVIGTGTGEQGARLYSEFEAKQFGFAIPQ